MNAYKDGELVTGGIHQHKKYTWQWLAFRGVENGKVVMQSERGSISRYDPADFGMEVK